ncbi:hypothetical protein K457DRAFT_126930 [Linnemannia elongata AG-77]|uniref:Mediator of RNA polymerase II transcription subunit 9 n=1 Tax=Linnemannia elongata AG-77 TaxID=1314771 RepID=A0A197JS55_9FUNG|nr:hypothetical protein K457DRAFT_126930 [Linnemannia elongata AG-77]
MSTALTSLPNPSDAQDPDQTFQPSDFSFLSQLLHILQKFEAGEDAQEIATLASNLKTSFKKCQMILDHLPGADLSADEQGRLLAEEQATLEKKRSQLKKYLEGQVCATPPPTTKQEEEEPSTGASVPQPQPPSPPATLKTELTSVMEGVKVEDLA